MRKVRLIVTSARCARAHEVDRSYKAGHQAIREARNFSGAVLSAHGVAIGILETCRKVGSYRSDLAAERGWQRKAINLDQTLALIRLYGLRYLLSSENQVARPSALVSESAMMSSESDEITLLGPIF